MRAFVFPTVVAALTFVGIFFWLGFDALALTVLLSVLEATLSFDNAVVNARVLERMSSRWQHRFLTWGIPIAVFGTRFILPILIVSAAAALSPIVVLKLALFEPAHYGQYLTGAHDSIAAFGTVFLLLVSLKYFFNTQKTVHWIERVERYMTRWGGIEAIEVALVLTVLLVSAIILPNETQTVLVAGMIGVILFIAIQGIAQFFEVETGPATAATGLALFIYLNVLDSAFSLDGVVAAFAITSALPIIIAGLGIGALYVRASTVALVHARTLNTLIYLEHGAHWAIFGIAATLYASMFVSVPETLAGFIGLIFISLAYISSRREMHRRTRARIVM